jgi:hypothetical protein
MNLAKTKRNIILPVSLAIIAFLAVFGPWSSFSVSKFSQNQRFENILSRYNMIKGNEIIKPARTVSNEDKSEISQILSYFERSHKFSDVFTIRVD